MHPRQGRESRKQTLGWQPHDTAAAARGRERSIQEGPAPGCSFQAGKILNTAHRFAASQSAGERGWRRREAGRQRVSGQLTSPRLRLQARGVRPSPERRESRETGNQENFGPFPFPVTLKPHMASSQPAGPLDPWRHARVQLMPLSLAAAHRAPTTPSVWTP